MHFLASQILQTTFLQVRKKIKTDPSNIQPKRFYLLEWNL